LPEVVNSTYNYLVLNHFLLELMVIYS